LLDLAPGRDGLERLRAYVSKRDFEATTSPADEREIAARTLAGIARRLIRFSERRQPRSDNVLLQRVTRTGGVLVVLLALLLAVSSLRAWYERRIDLAAGKPWQASSSYETVCRSPLHHCGLDKDYFFHTQDESNPWLEIDLTRPQRFSQVRVTNRQDCCSERAVPLVVEVSSDRKTWREVARRAESFDEWRPRFKPQSARWVRFRVARRSLLHLSDVRVLP
jgi:hypothetical protein